MKRRDFFKISALSAIAASPVTKIFEKNKSSFIIGEKKFANDVVTLGKTGIRVSRLAMGTGTHGINRRSNQTDKLGIKGVADLLKEAFDNGINFWDSADQYGTHPHLKEALKLVPREKVVILTKTHADSVEEMEKDLERFRNELGTDYIDIILLHLMMDKNWPDRKQGAMEVLAKAREDGIIRAHGVSCHTIEALETAAETDWVQVDLARINPRGTNMDDDVSVVEKVLQKMHSSGKGIIGMKIFGGGRLRNNTDECLRYILKQNYVDAFTIGQENRSEMMDLVKRIPDVST